MGLHAMYDSQREREGKHPSAPATHAVIQNDETAFERTDWQFYHSEKDARHSFKSSDAPAVLVELRWTAKNVPIIASLLATK